MPFHAFPSGLSGYLDPLPRPELPSPTGVFRLLALVAAIAGSSVAMAAEPASAMMAGNRTSTPEQVHRRGR